METKRVITSMDMEHEAERIVDVTPLYLLANFNPKVPEDALTTLADTVEKNCRDFYHAIHANGSDHVRISVDKRKSSGKISEVIPKEVQRERLMAVAGLITLNIYPYLNKDILAKWYGLDSGNHMASLVPEICRGDGHYKGFERGQATTRDVIRILTANN